MLYLNHGHDKKEPFILPPGWEVVNPMEAEDQVPAQPIDEMIRDALASPVGSPVLKDLVKGAKKIAIIVDDATRPTPVEEILAVLLGDLHQQGFPKKKISIVVALGSHEPLSDQGLAERLGADTASSYRIVQHNALQDNLVPVKAIGDEMAVRINPVVAEADFKIGVSSILPHPMAGYGGGPKILMPGVADAPAFTRHHMTTTIHPRSRIGVTEGNPFHEACMKVALAVGLELSVNCVYNRQGALTGIIAGGLEEAFQAAVAECRRMLACRFEENVDVTITSSYPHTHGVQFCKGLGPPGIITKETGAILLFAPLTAPVQKEFVDSVALVRERFGSEASGRIRGIMEKGELVLPDKSPEFNMALYDLVGRPHIKRVVVSEAVSPDTAGKLGLGYAPSVQEGVKVLEELYPNAKVAVFPSGGLIIPGIGTKE